MTEPLTTLLHDTAGRVPAALHPAANLRRHAEHHQRVRRAGAAVSLAVVLVIGLLGFVAQGGSRKAAPPAEQAPLSRSSLLIADEIEPVFMPLPNTWLVSSTGEGEADEPVTSCQQGSLEDLGAEQIWHRVFAGVDSYPEGSQVTARFASPRRAAEAFDVIDAWFDSCPGLKQPVWQWPEFGAFGGRARSTTVLRPVPGEAFSTRYDSVSYGIIDDTVTVLRTTQEKPDDGPPEQNASAETPLKATMLFALQRIGDSRSTTENAVPGEFTFAEDLVGSSDGAEPRVYLGTGWRVGNCFPPLSPKEALRTGMVTSALSIGETIDDPARYLQLAVYSKEAAARGAAEDLRAEIAACAERSSGYTIHPVQTAWGQQDIQVMFEARSDGFERNAGATAGSVIQRGNSVFVPSAVFAATIDRTGSELRPDALASVQQEIRDNLDRVCTVIAGCR